MLGVKKLGDCRLVRAAEIALTASTFAEYALAAFIR